MPRRSRRHGSVLLYVTVAMVAFTALVCMAVDFGHARYVKSQLQGAADAAARYAANVYVASGMTAAANAAVQSAAANNADGSPVVLNSATDVLFGSWDSSTKTFTAGTSPATAIQVVARRTAATGNPVHLSFGGLIGLSVGDVTAKCTVITNGGGFGVVGLNSISMSGNSSISYWSPSGTTSQHGSIASNGSISLSGNTAIQGDARPGAGYSVSLGGGASVSGSTAPLATPLSYPAGSAGAAASSNNNAQLPSNWFNSSTRDFNIGGSNSATIPGGVYYVNNWGMGQNASVTFTGPTTLYVTGAVNNLGSLTTYSNTPSNLKIIVCGTSNVTIGSQNAVYAQIYAPQSAVSFTGGGDLYGSVVGLSISMTGGSGIHYDLSLPGALAVQVVQ